MARPKAAWGDILPFRRQEAAPPVLSGDRVLGFALGRQALAFALKYLFPQKGLIAIPDYICREVPRAVRHAGHEVFYYRIGQDLKPDMGSVRESLVNGARAILVVHYFGFPAQMDEISALCRQMRVVLIEDCAHCHTSFAGNRLVGGQGTFAIFSPRKFFPLPDGGTLLINDDELWLQANKSLREVPSSAAPVVKWRVKEMASLLKLDGALSLFSRLLRSTGITGREGDDADLTPAKPSDLSFHIAARHDAGRVAVVHRRHYQRLAKSMAAIPQLKPLYDALPDGIAPLYFPVRAVNARSICEAMLAKGIELTLWPFLPPEVKSDPRAVAANKLAREVIGIPLHAQADPDVMLRALQNCLRL
jgi:hypothetical protein